MVGEVVVSIVTLNSLDVVNKLEMEDGVDKVVVDRVDKDVMSVVFQLEDV